MSDDPVNPRHYAGTACAEIGERLSANSYQVLKYTWRLGKKDEGKVELGKAIWYLEREIDLSLCGVNTRPRRAALPTTDFFEQRLIRQPPFTVAVAKMLLEWNRHGTALHLLALRGALQRELEAVDA